MIMHDFGPHRNDDDRLKALFDLVAEAGVTSQELILTKITDAGISAGDGRLRHVLEKLKSMGDQPIPFENFAAIVRQDLLIINRILRKQLVIPDWPEFCDAIRQVYDHVAGDRSGSNADYIPILKDADPDKWGVAICSIDGQRFSVGDVDVYHSIQSVSKPITYAYALNREGVKFTHEFVGVEPSGRPFNALDLLPDMRPFNPCVNAGAIMVAGVVASGFPDLTAREITQKIMSLWGSLCGDVGEVHFSEETMLSEKATADNNFAIAYLLQGRKGLPRNVELHKMIELYLSCCSIEMTAEMLSVAAATLANGGVCPLTGEQVLPTELVKKTLAVMQFAGMYDNAGSFTLEVGLPAKSGVAGAVMVIIPNLMGFATFSPRLDGFGNSVRGVAFCRELVNRFTFHVYDSLSGSRSGCKLDPRESQNNRRQRDLTDLRWALSQGDRYAMKVYELVLSSMMEVCLANGEAEAAEVSVIADTLENLMGMRPPISSLERELINHQSGLSKRAGWDTLDALERRLSSEKANLDDNSRELILESAFRVACADGEVQGQEYELLGRIADALGIYRGVLDIDINRFRKRLSG